MVQHLRHARCDVFGHTNNIRFVNDIIPFDDDSDAVVRQDAQNSPPTFCCYSSTRTISHRGSGIYKTAAIYVLRKEKRLLTTGQITRYIVKARYAIRDVDAMRRLSLSLSRAFFLHATSAAAAFALGGGGLVPFRSFFSLSLPPWSRTRVPLLTECSRM